jgi:hypothetical protein
MKPLTCMGSGRSDSGPLSATQAGQGYQRGTRRFRAVYLAIYASDDLSDEIPKIPLDETETTRSISDVAQTVGVITDGVGTASGRFCSVSPR